VICPVCDFPLEPPVVEVNFDRIYRVHRGCAAYLPDVEAELRSFNKEFAIVHDRDGGTRVVRLRTGHPSMAVSLFLNVVVANRRVRILRRGRLVEDFPLAQLWMEWPEHGVLLATAEIDEDAKTLDLIFWGAQ
jgi:hypothetical protein